MSAPNGGNLGNHVVVKYSLTLQKKITKIVVEHYCKSAAT